MNLYLLALQFALGLVPQVLEIIKAIEMPGNGAAKAKVVADLVSAGLDTMPPEFRSKIPVGQIQMFISLATSILVAYLNARGAFQTRPGGGLAGAPGPSSTGGSALPLPGLSPFPPPSTTGGPFAEAPKEKTPEEIRTKIETLRGKLSIAPANDTAKLKQIIDHIEKLELKLKVAEAEAAEKAG